MSSTMVDVALIGYGPVSKVLSMMLARQGRSVAVFERFPEAYALPRAVCIDHELYRVLHTAGFAREVEAVTQPAPLYQWFNADWKLLLEIDWTQESISGGPDVHFVHQPTLEASLDAAVGKHPNISVHRGWEGIGLSQTPDHATVEIRSTVNGETKTVDCRYLVGVDGANSFVRESLGITRDDLGFEADWLILDMLLNEGLTHESLGIPAAGQYCNPVRPTTIVPGGMQNGRVCRRWEFMRLPHETKADMESTEAVWRLLGRWVKPDQAELVRHTIYTFRSLLANQWRVGRVLLAGDAAHLMPPFMGQGMCAGMRDAWNLSWKLGLILDGKAAPSLLDTYMEERRPHVTDIIRASIYLGQIICIADPEKAAERDRAFLGGTAPPPPHFPSLVQGLLHEPSSDPLAGKLSPHGTVTSGGRTGRYDDLIEPGFTIVSRAGDARAALGAGQKTFLEAIGATFVSVTDQQTSDASSLIDVDGKFIPFLTSHGVEAIIVRPDFYIFGSAPTLADLGGVVDALRHATKSYGIAREVETAVA